MSTPTEYDYLFKLLLIGDSGGRREFLKSYGFIHRISTVPHADVVAFASARNLHGRGIGWIDAHLLAAALVADAPLWTADERLSRLASELEVGYVPSFT